MQKVVYIFFASVYILLIVGLSSLADYVSFFPLTLAH